MRDCGNCFYMQDFVCVSIRDTGKCPYIETISFGEDDEEVE